MFKVSQKGKVFFVEDTVQDLIVGRFDSKESAVVEAKRRAQDAADYFKGMKVDVKISENGTTL